MGVASLGVVAGGGARASADEPVVAGTRTEAPTATRPPLLPPAQRLQLSWPIQPLSFSFRASEEGNYAAGPLRLFQAEATWLRLGRLSVLTTSAAERAFELDCRLTCQPIVSRSMAVEGRLHLFSTRAVPEAHAFTRYEARWSDTGSAPPIFSPTRGGLLRVGIAGQLDL
jgi:hypothetical protein